MTILPKYEEISEVQKVGVLIAETYCKFNLDFATPEEQVKILGPFRFAGSTETVLQVAITRVLATDMIFVAEDTG